MGNLELYRKNGVGKIFEASRIEQFSVMPLYVQNQYKYLNL